MCEQVQVLHFNLHMPLEFLVFCGTLLQTWLYKLLVAQKAMLKLVYLNRLVTLHISGLKLCERDPFFCVCMGVAFVCLCFKH